MMSTWVFTFLVDRGPEAGAEANRQQRARNGGNGQRATKARTKVSKAPTRTATDRQGPQSDAKERATRHWAMA